MRNSRAVLSLVFLLFCSPTIAPAQPNITSFTPYWKHKVSLFRSLENPVGAICFLGDSITDGCEWAELTWNPLCINRGISYDTAWGVLARIDEVTVSKPAKVFMMIGTNDLSHGKSPVAVNTMTGRIIDAIQSKSPSTEIYLQSVLPVVDNPGSRYSNSNIVLLNSMLSKLASRKNITFIDLAPAFRDSNRQLRRGLTEDGLHLTGEGYKIWHGMIKKYLD